MQPGRMRGQPREGGVLLRGARRREGRRERVAPASAGALLPRDPGKGGGRGGGGGARLRVPGSRRPPTAAPLRPRPGAGGRRGAPAPRPPRDASRGDWSGGGRRRRRQTGAALGAHGRSSSSASSRTEPCRSLLLRPAGRRRRRRIPAASAPRAGGGDAAGPPPLEGTSAAARSLGRRRRGLSRLPPPAPADRRDGAPGLGAGQRPERGVHGAQRHGGVLPLDLVHHR